MLYRTLEWLNDHPPPTHPTPASGPNPWRRPWSPYSTSHTAQQCPPPSNPPPPDKVVHKPPKRPRPPSPATQARTRKHARQPPKHVSPLSLKRPSANPPQPEPPHPKKATHDPGRVQPRPPLDPPPPYLSVGPNFRHPKARVQAVGLFPFGTRKPGSRPFAAPTPRNKNGAGPKAGPAHTHTPRMPSQPRTYCGASHGDQGGGRRTTSMLGSGTRMVTQQVVVLSQTSEQVDPFTTTPPPACASDGRGARSRHSQGPKSGGTAGLTA